MVGRRMHRRLVRLHIERDDHAHRGFCKAGPGKCSARQRQGFVGIAAALAADSQRQMPWMIDEPVRGVRIGLVGDGDASVGIGRDRQAGARQPVRRAVQRHAVTRHQIGHEPGCMRRVGQHITLGRRIERDAEPDIARRRDRGLDAERIGRLARQIVGAAMPAQKRHDRTAIVGNGDHRRLRLLVRKHRCQQPHQRPGGHHRDKRPAIAVKRAQMIARIVEKQIGPVGAHALARAMHRAADRFGNPARDRQPRFAQDHNDGLGRAHDPVSSTGDGQASSPL